MSLLSVIAGVERHVPHLVARVTGLAFAVSSGNDNVSALQVTRLKGGGRATVMMGKMPVEVKVADLLPQGKPKQKAKRKPRTSLHSKPSSRIPGPQTGNFLKISS